MAKALRFTHVQLENWRNFSHAEVHLARRVFLVGPNASGKSNFLDALRFLRDIASVGSGFQAAVQTKRGGVSKLRCLAARRPSDILIKVRVGTDQEPSLWEYALRFAQDNRRRAVIKGERVVRGGTEVLLDRPNEEDQHDPERLTQTYLEQINVNREFREVAEFLGSVRYLHIVPQLIRDPSRSTGMKNDPFGGDFLEQVAMTPEKSRDSRLRRIRDALRLAVPKLRDLELWRDERGTPHLRGRYEHWRLHGAWHTEDQFSDGTLRLLGLLWVVLDGSGPLLLEEPELSLHPEVVGNLPRMFARMQRRTGRQVLLSTHSKDLLQDRRIGLDEVLLLHPVAEGTSINAASQYDDVQTLLASGATPGEAVLPRTGPDKAEQLSLYGD